MKNKLPIRLVNTEFVNLAFVRLHLLNIKSDKIEFLNNIEKKLGKIWIVVLLELEHLDLMLQKH